eukprot:351583-Chlamydomonas_euryale.AAC.10
MTVRGAEDDTWRSPRLAALPGLGLGRLFVAAAEDTPMGWRQRGAMPRGESDRATQPLAGGRAPAQAEQVRKGPGREGTMRPPSAAGSRGRISFMPRKGEGGLASERRLLERVGGVAGGGVAGPSAEPARCSACSLGGWIGQSPTRSAERETVAPGCGATSGAAGPRRAPRHPKIEQTAAAVAACGRGRAHAGATQARGLARLGRVSDGVPDRAGEGGGRSHAPWRSAAALAAAAATADVSSQTHAICAQRQAERPDRRRAARRLSGAAVRPGDPRHARDSCEMETMQFGCEHALCRMAAMQLAQAHKPCKVAAMQRGHAHAACKMDHARRICTRAVQGRRPCRRVAAWATWYACHTPRVLPLRLQERSMSRAMGRCLSP